jgi:hypothetical protein
LIFLKKEIIDFNMVGFCFKNRDLVSHGSGGHCVGLWCQEPGGMVAETISSDMDNEEEF